MTERSQEYDLTGERLNKYIERMRKEPTKIPVTWASVIEKLEKLKERMEHGIYDKNTKNFRMPQG